MPTYDNINTKPEWWSTEEICCKSNEDTENCREIVKDGDVNNRNRWLCSHTYEDTTYSLHVCPFKRSSCGPNNKINFYDIGDDGSVHIRDLDEGESCTYVVENVCGAPSFSINDKSGSYRAFFLEW